MLECNATCEVDGNLDELLVEMTSAIECFFDNLNDAEGITDLQLYWVLKDSVDTALSNILVEIIENSSN